jgi:beta-lactamase regulating signal transducer with metallopeptidase domain
MNAEIVAGSDEMIAAILNGVYQGIILTLLVYLVLRLIGPINAATRYWIWGSTLALVMALIPAHYLRDRFFADPAPLTIISRESKPVLDTAPARLFEVAVPEVVVSDKAAFLDQELTSLPGQAELPEVDQGPAICFDEPLAVKTDSTAVPPLLSASDWTESAAAGGGQTAVTSSSTASSSEHELKPGWHGWGLERMLNPISWNVSSLAGFPKIGSVVLLLTWLGVTVFKAGRLCGRLYQIRKIKKAALPAGPELTGLFARLRADLDVRRRVDLKLCPVPASPVALGFFHPVILLPEEYATRPEAPETEQILRHELAHVRRHDDWANLAQNFIQAGLFFHPAVWWISKRLALEREIACDDYVLQRGVGPRAYALLLADLAARLKRQDLVFAQGVSSSKSQLQQRINMILNTRRNTSPGLAKARLGFVTASAALIALLALYSAPRVVLAQAPSVSAAVAPVPPAPSAAVISVAPAIAPVAIIASADEPDATPSPDALPNVGPGPKFKPGEPGADALPRAPGAPAAIMVTPLPPGSIEIAADVHPKPVPHPPGTPSADGSLEERIERLEKMVESLMAQQGQKHAFILRGRSGDQNLQALVDEKEMQKMNEKMNEMAKRQAERAQEQAQRAQEQAKRAAEQAQRANKDFNFKWKAEAEQWQKGMNHEGLEKQLEALRKAREQIERQAQNLDRQIERLERDQERMQEEKERRSELKDEEPKEEEAASVAENEEN